MSGSSRKRSTRFVAMVSTVVVAAVGAALLIPLAAAAAPLVLTGVVDGPNGKPMAGVAVDTVDTIGDGTYLVISSTTTSSTGTFGFTADDTSGSNTLWFPATTTTFAQFLGDTSDPSAAQSYGYFGSGGQQFLQVTLAPSGSISGTVTELPKGNLSGYTVRAYAQLSDGSWTLDRSGVSSSSGAYSVTGLEPGSYRLEAIDLSAASPPYAPAYSGGATELSGATSVGVVAGSSAVYKFALGKAGSVSGTVTGLANSVVSNLGSVHVTPYRLDGTPGSFTSATALDSPGAITSSTGKYTVGGLAPGYYTFEFNPPTAASPATQFGRTFLGSSDSPTTANYVQITNGTVVASQNIQLLAGATISGVVEDGSNSDAPVDEERVSAVYSGRDADLASEHAQTVETGVDGAFTFTGLGPGTWDLWVGSNSNTDPNSQNENLSYIRQVVTVGPLTAGESIVENPIMTPKNLGYLDATTQPALSTTTANVGDTVSVSNGVWNAPDATFTYQWVLNDNQPIPGATASSYKLKPGDVDNYVSAVVTAHSFEYGVGQSYASNAIQQVGAASFGAPSPAPSISGTAAVGQTLTVDPGNWGVSGTDFTFQWQVNTGGSNWLDLDGDYTSQSVTIDGGDFQDGDQLRVIIIGQKYGYNPASQTVVDGSTLVSSPIQLVTAPTVVKSATNYSLSDGVWNPALADLSTVNWTILAPDGTTTQFSQVTMPIGSVAGDYVTATMQHQLAGWISTTTSPIVVQQGAAATASGSTAMTGTPVVGGLLSAPSPTWLPSSGTSTWQWQYESGTKWLNIVGASDSTYAPGASDVGRLLRVITTRTQPFFATGTLASVASAKVAMGAAPALNAEGFSGTVGTGANVTVNPSWSPAPTTKTYQWEYSKTSSSGPWTKISGATTNVYTIPQSLLGDWLGVVQTAAIPGHSTASVTYAVGAVAENQLTLTSIPKITDVGGTYTVSNVTFSPAVPAANVKYTWVHYDENDSGYTVSSILGGPSYDIAASGTPQAHWGVVIAVPTDPGTSYTYESPAPVLVQKGSTIPSGPITLPSAQVGAGVSAPAITWLVQNPTVTYQWQYETGTTWKSIASSSGGTSATFTPSATYYNHNIRVIETASRANYATASETSTSSVVGLGTAPTAGTGANEPGINGYGIGTTWSAFPGTWSLTGLTYHYQWAFSWTSSGPWIPITGATATTYAPPDDLLGYYLQVTITGSKTGYATGSTTAETVALQDGQIRSITSPKVTLSNGTYTVTSNGTWSPAPTSYEYYWDIVNPATNVATQVSTTNSYTTSGADVGDQIVLTMYPDRAGYTSGGIVVYVRQGPTIEPTSPITLTGTPVIGGTLQLNIPGWNTNAPEVHVTWYRNGVATGTSINSLTYTPVAADLGDVISAKLTADEQGDVSSSFSFASAPVVSNVVLAPTVQPALSGSLLIGTTESATPGTWNVPGLTFAYQWYRGSVPIPGATASTYLLTGADFLFELSVTVTASKTNYTTQSASSEAETVYNDTTKVVISNSLPQPISITGSLVAGTGVATMSVGGTWSTPVSLSFSWFVSTDGGSTWVSVPFQYSKSLPLTAANGIATGDLVEAQVLATAPGYYEDGINSAPVTVQ